MESSAKRTLMKSAPEVWELADDLAKMEAWMADLTGSSGPLPVEVAEREPERLIAWRAASNGRDRVEIKLAEDSFGTSVSVTAELEPGTASGIDERLERLLDDLAQAERRPFERA
jgi:hypothetical protein